MVCVGRMMTRAVLVTLSLSSVLAAGGEKNRTRTVTDPLQRVMLEFNLYQVQLEREGGGVSSDCVIIGTRGSR